MVNSYSKAAVEIVIYGNDIKHGSLWRLAFTAEDSVPELGKIDIIYFLRVKIVD